MASYNDIYYMIMEKKSREKYRMDKFKKQYDFSPDYTKDKFGNVGTINVNGHRVSADLDIHNPTLSGTKFIPREISAVHSQGPEGIVFDKNFFKLKNKKRMDAMVNHEIGHLKMHSLQSDAKVRDPKFVSSVNLEQSINNVLNTLPAEFKQNKKQIREEVKEVLGVNGYLKSGSASEQEKKIRNACWNIAKKYAKPGVTHANPQEFEADRYAANKTSKRDVKRALREMYKRNRHDKDKKMYMNRDIAKNLGKYMGDNRVNTKRGLTNFTASQINDSKHRRCKESITMLDQRLLMILNCEMQKFISK